MNVLYSSYSIRSLSSVLSDMHFLISYFDLSCNFAITLCLIDVPVHSLALILSANTYLALKFAPSCFHSINCSLYLIISFSIVYLLISFVVSFVLRACTFLKFSVHLFSNKVHCVNNFPP